MTQEILRRLGRSDLPADPQHGPFAPTAEAVGWLPAGPGNCVGKLRGDRPARARTLPTCWLPLAAEAGIDAAAGGDLWQDKTKSLLRCIEYSHSNLSTEAQALLACWPHLPAFLMRAGCPQYTAQLGGTARAG
ncbi:MAG: hypothetical protein H6660_11340 [Ardenticatenaceae bacterium]|nr:hypothetical protein [Ardenticatenaceae bacterium]